MRITLVDDAVEEALLHNTNGVLKKWLPGLTPCAFLFGAIAVENCLISSPGRRVTLSLSLCPFRLQTVELPIAWELRGTLLLNRRMLSLRKAKSDVKKGFDGLQRWQCL